MNGETAAKFIGDGAVITTTTQKFETTSNGVKITGGLQDADGDLGTSGQVLSSTGTALNWVDADSTPQGVQGLKVTMVAMDLRVLTVPTLLRDCGF